MRGMQEKRYFYWIVGTIAVCISICITLMFFCVRSFVYTEYSKKINNICMQFGNNFKQQLSSVEGCVNRFSSKYGTGLERAEIYDEMRVLRLSDINISYVITIIGTATYDNGFAVLPVQKLRDQIQQEFDGTTKSKWFVNDEYKSLIYAVRNNDGSVIAIATSIEPLLKDFMNNTYLKNVRLQLSDGLNTVGVKDRIALEKYGHNLELNYETEKSDLELKYYIPVPVEKIMAKWIYVVMLVFFLQFFVCTLVASKFVDGIFKGISKLKDRMQEYINNKW